MWAITKDSLTSYELPKGEQIKQSALQVYELLTARSTSKRGEIGLATTGAHHSSRSQTARRRASIEPDLARARRRPTWQQTAGHRRRRRVAIHPVCHAAGTSGQWTVAVVECQKAATDHRPPTTRTT